MDNLEQNSLNERLGFASEGGDLDEVKSLITKGADVNSNYGRALKNASRDGRLETVKYLIEQGADVNISEEHRVINAIDYAATRGHLDVVKVLVENGADVNRGIKSASAFERPNIVKYLHQNGADLDSAISSSFGKTKEVLVEYKASIEEKTLIQSDLKEVKQEQKQTPSRRI
jgi:ankyrin repeat protein